ncbi:MAG: SDR family NAD(P)-dependent oxidoreductase [Acidimicrobiales bacterium]
MARQLAAAGFEVIVTARSLDAARSVATQLQDEGLAARALQLDIADPDSVAAAAQALDHTGLNVLVNNAAAFADWSESASTADLAEARSVMDVNLFGTWRVTQALLPALRARPRARIVNVGSGAACSHGDPAAGLAASLMAASYTPLEGRSPCPHLEVGGRVGERWHPGRRRRPGLTTTAPGDHGSPTGDGRSDERGGRGHGRTRCQRHVHRDGVTHPW